MKDNKFHFDVIVIGGGPAGLSAALASNEKGSKTLIVEREKKLGGILKQCIHDGFGLITFNETLSGPEYADRYMRKIMEKDISIYTSTFVSKVEKVGESFILTLINSREDVFQVSSKALVLANGCRERTSRQVFINGDRPAGIYSAGTAQYLTNIMGYLPCKNCVILGSGDIGLIMARRLTLEGAKVIGVYEMKSTPSGLSRNIMQCLEDYNIPLHLSHTVTRVIGESKVSAVETCRVDENMKLIDGTEEIIKCDGLILSVGLIPENEVAESLNIEIDPLTKGPKVDHNFRTSVNGVFSCGNSLHVNDLVDYVSESGKYAGEQAATYEENSYRKLVDITFDKKEFLYVVPQSIDLNSIDKDITIYFRSKDVIEDVKVEFYLDNKVVFMKKYNIIKPPEMEKIILNLKSFSVNNIDNLNLVMSKIKEGV